MIRDVCGLAWAEAGRLGYGDHTVILRVAQKRRGPDGVWFRKHTHERYAKLLRTLNMIAEIKVEGWTWILPSDLGWRMSDTEVVDGQCFMDIQPEELDKLVGRNILLDPMHAKAVIQHPVPEDRHTVGWMAARFNGQPLAAVVDHCRFEYPNSWPNQACVYAVQLGLDKTEPIAFGKLVSRALKGAKGPLRKQS